jgi:hypothetical protein
MLKILCYSHENFATTYHAKIWKEDIFKPKIRNESLQEISNNNGVRRVNFAISKILSEV